MAPGSRHKGDFPEDAGSVGTRSTGHRAQHWVGVCRCEDLVGSAWDAAGSSKAAGTGQVCDLRRKKGNRQPPATRVGRTQLSSAARRPVHEWPAGLLPARERAEGSRCSTPLPGACGGLRREAWEVGLSGHMEGSQQQPDSWVGVSEQDPPKPTHLPTGEVLSGIAALLFCPP